MTSHPQEFVCNKSDVILVTGATGFIGSRVIEVLLSYGFTNLRCLARSSANAAKLESVAACWKGASVQILKGNLLSPEDCLVAVEDATVIYHLAAGRGQKSFPDAFMHSVVTTRNLLEAAHRQKCLRRFVNVSSFSVYSNDRKPNRRILDESCPVETRPELRGDAYTFAKVKQDQLVCEYGEKLRIPYVIVRPGFVYGPGNEAITGRIGVGTFGIFLHFGGGNSLPLTYVDNCAEAIVLAGLKPGIDGEVFNIVDDDLPSSRSFLRLYKRQVKSFRSLYVPRLVSYLFCLLWEKYSGWSHGQLPPMFNRRTWHAYWKKTAYTNAKAKRQLGWAPRVHTRDALDRHLQSCRVRSVHA